MEVLRPGLYSSIQDIGRFSYLSYGVPVSGAMDIYSHKLANLYLQNPRDAATLEITLSGPTLKFSQATQIVITGADLSAKLDNTPLQHSVVVQVHQGGVLTFEGRNSGCRTYLGVKGGFQTEKVLGSRSWLEGISKEGRLQKGMMLPYITTKEFTAGTLITATSNAHINEEQFNEKTAIKVFPGPEFSCLNKAQQQVLLDTCFHISPLNNRMGIHLEELLPNSLQPIITGPVMPGTVQLTPSGKLIVLMRDCQTTGGYPRVLQLTMDGINQIAQRTTSEEVRWSHCSFV